ncbi:hypothetical protein [Psychrobacter sp. I-STPA10]|uniref:hypothetical protein n=1 Tax=Psychrobacter sp. I-STPA10 TaxID=2585769 RepID=UPI001E4551A7|nr:hypothetical protein [Psychrobacter sp. I-STPA10]
MDDDESFEEYKQRLELGHQAFARVNSECASLGLNLGAKALMIEHAIEQGIEVEEYERVFLNFYQWIMQMTYSLGLEPDFLGTQLMPQASQNAATIIDYIDAIEESNTTNKAPKPPKC